MDPDEVEDFMKECNRLLEESQSANPRTSMSRPDEDDTLQKGPSEVDELKHLLHLHRLEMADLRHQLSQMQPTSPGVQIDKVFLCSLSPMEYAGESDFEDYLSQFEAMAGTLYWSEEKKGSALYGRLKGKTLTCVSSCVVISF